MRFKGLDLNLLIALDALLTHRNVTRAAEHVSMSQSAMSGALAKLREHFQDELLVQVNRRMVPTPLAQSIDQPLRDLLANIAKLVSARSGFDPATSERRFTISCSDYVWSVVIADALHRVAVEAPGVAVCYAGTSARFVRSDADLLIAPEGYLSKDDPSEELFREDYVCIVWAENSLVGEAVSEEQFFALGHVVAYFERRTFVQEWLYNRYGGAPRVATVAPNFCLVPRSVVGTNHIAVVPRRLARSAAAHLPLRILEPPLAIPVMVDRIQWRAYQSDDPGLAWLRAVVIAAARRALPDD